MRKEGDSAKSINEMLLSRLSRYRASPSATLAALTGSTISNTLKEDQAGERGFLAGSWNVAIQDSGRHPMKSPVI